MRIALLFAMLLLSTGFQQGVSQSVQTNGPDKGRIGRLASMDTILFAGTDGGVFVSTGRGSSSMPPDAVGCPRIQPA